jgi:endonuclease/exonuclease/phosphatase family metal-dependent hydrolase
LARDVLGGIDPMRRMFAAFLTVAACAPAAASSTQEGDIGSKPDRAWAPAAPKTGNLRIATFNIRNFPRGVLGDAGADAGETDERPRVVRSQDETDQDALVDILAKLDFDVLAVQEINDTQAFRDLLARLGDKKHATYEAVFDDSWDHPQRVGIVVRTDHARVESPKVHGEVATRPTMRAGLSARIVSTKKGGADFGVMVVHLASGDTSGRATLRQAQAEQAANVVAARQAELGDQDFIVLGDMNTAREEQEFGGLDAAYASHATSLARQKPDLACTSYYVKSAGQPLVQPAWIDQVYLASLAERDESVPLSVGAHCFERTCQPFESDSKDNGTSYWAVSDHCPVYFEIRDQDQD